MFADPTPWASGKTESLEALRIFKCPGVEAGKFVRNVLRGTYGTRLKEVKFISNGIGIPDIPPASGPVLASVERLHADNVAAWENIRPVPHPDPRFLTDEHETRCICRIVDAARDVGLWQDAAWISRIEVAQAKSIPVISGRLARVHS